MLEVGHFCQRAKLPVLIAPTLFKFTVFIGVGAIAISGCGGGNNGGGESTVPPVANAGGPYSGNVGQTINFNGSSSTAPSGQSITSYAWSFGDSTAGSGVSPTHSYSVAGIFEVTLTVTDTAGGTGTASATTTISALPVANAGGPYAATVGQTITFSGSASTAPSGQSITSYAWDFGDSTTGNGVNPTHSYSVAGTYNLALTVTDTSGATASSSTSVNITPAIPPQVISTVPANGATDVATSANVIATFSKAINPSTLTGTSFLITDNTNSVPVHGTIQVDQSNITATFVPSEPLAAGHSFSGTLTSAIKDLTGDNLPGNVNFGFVTGPLSYESDSTTFSVLSRTPPAPPVISGGEADSLTFSVLNGVAPAKVPPTVLEVDSLTFSVENTAPSPNSLTRRAETREETGNKSATNVTGGPGTAGPGVITSPSYSGTCTKLGECVDTARIEQERKRYSYLGQDYDHIRRSHSVSRRSLSNPRSWSLRGEEKDRNRISGKLTIAAKNKHVSSKQPAAFVTPGSAPTSGGSDSQNVFHNRIKTSRDQANSGAQ